MSRKMQPIDPAERSKIAKLQTELKDKNSEHKVEWLYSGDKIDRDAYLLGKPVDKLLLEKEAEKPKENDFVVSTIDLASKIREDPLFEIKKREIEAKKKLLENPMKLKQLKQMIKNQSDDDLSSNESDLDRDRSKRKDKHSHKKSKKKHKKSKYSSSDSSEVEEKKRKKKHRSRSRSSTRSRSRDRSRRDTRNEKNYGLIKNRDEKNLDDHSTHRYRNEEKPKSHIEIEDYKKKIEKLKQIRKTDSGYKPSNVSKNVTNKLSEEEKQRRLKEMEENANWRNEIRSKNIKTYKIDEKREDELQERDKSHQMQNEAANMFNNIMRDAYVSAEDRIKRNIHNIQRNKSSYDQNFARK